MKLRHAGVPVALLLYPVAKADAAGCVPFGLPASCACTFIAGTSLDWYFVEDASWTAFSTSQKADVQSAAAVWGDLSGLDWTFVEAGTTGSTDAAAGLTALTTNSVNEVVLVDQAWWTAAGLPAMRRALSYPRWNSTTCERVGGDLIVLDDAAAGWDYALPSTQSPPVISFGQTMIHEFGHMMGLAHDNVIPTIMNYRLPHGGDPGDGVSFSVWPDEHKALADEKGGAATSDKYVLYKWELVTSTDKSREVWTDESAADPLDRPTVPETWTICPGSTVVDRGDPLDQNVPVGVNVGVLASGPRDVTVVWKLVEPGNSCRASPHEMARSVVTSVLPGVATYVEPSFVWASTLLDELDGFCLFGTAAYSTSYELCAYIEEADADDLDQVVYSDKLFETPPQFSAPDACCNVALPDPSMASLCAGDTETVCD